MELQYEKDSKERIPYEHYMELFQKADPAEISARTGIPYDKQSQTFNLHLLGVAYQVHFPDYVVTHDPESTVGYYPLEAAINARILVLRYLVEGHSAPSTGKYLTYRARSGNTVGNCISETVSGQMSDASCLWIWQQTGGVPVCNGKDWCDTSRARRYRL